MSSVASSHTSWIFEAQVASLHIFGQQSSVVGQVCHTLKGETSICPHKLRPYVEVTFAHRDFQQRTRIGCRLEGKVQRKASNFSELSSSSSMFGNEDATFTFPRCRDATKKTVQDLSAPSQCLTFAFDERSLSTFADVRIYSERRKWSLSSDKLIGEARLNVNADLEEGFGVVGKSVCLELRSDGHVVGTLLLQLHVRNIAKALQVLAFDSPVMPRDIAEAASCLLSSSENVDRLVDSRPVEIAQKRPRDQIRNEVDTLVREFTKKTVAFVASPSSPNVVEHLAPIARLIMDYVARLIGSSSHAREVAILWLDSFFAGLQDSTAAGKMTAVLQNFFNAARPRFQDITPLDSEGKAISIVDMRRFHEDILADAMPQQVVLGRGSYATIWRGKDQHTGKVYAVKTFHRDRCLQNRIPAWECNVSSQLSQGSHPNVNRIYQVFQNSTVPIFSIVMELCSGGDLGQKISSARCEAEGKVPTYQAPTESLSWLGQILAGLEYLHLERDMLHLDLKPANVVIDSDGIAKLIDFGFCNLGKRSDGDFACGVPPGSPEYIAPEVLQGNGFSFSADLYSYGVLIWMLYTGGVRNRHGFFSPPCAEWQPPQTEPLQTNWQRLRDAMLQSAPQILDPNAKDLISKLTFRGDGWDTLQHDDVRKHVLFQDVDSFSRSIFTAA